MIEASGPHSYQDSYMLRIPESVSQRMKIESVSSRTMRAFAPGNQNNHVFDNECVDAGPDSYFITESLIWQISKKVHQTTADFPRVQPGSICGRFSAIPLNDTTAEIVGNFNLLKITYSSANPS